MGTNTKSTPSAALPKLSEAEVRADRKSVV